MKSVQVTQGTAAQRSRRAVVAAPAAPPPAKLTKLFLPKIVAPRGPTTDPKELERERLVAALVAAQDRSAIFAATTHLLSAGHEPPETQEVQLQLLEHADESRVRGAIESLSAILAREPARRRPVLEQRLKRIAECGDDRSTRDAAAALRRKL